jgi:hypothetical protein
MYSKRNWNTWKPTSQFATTRFIRLLLYTGFHNTAICITLHFIFMNNKNNNNDKNNLRHNTVLHYIHIHGQHSLLLEACEPGLFWKEDFLICGARPTEVPTMRTRANKTTEHKQADNAAAGAGPTFKWTICIQNYRDSIYFVCNLSFSTKG